MAIIERLFCFVNIPKGGFQAFFRHLRDRSAETTRNNVVRRIERREERTGKRGKRGREGRFSGSEGSFG